jgi:aspartyl/asparaginyl beta-hydroxylase (cupin superfamily)
MPKIVNDETIFTSMQVTDWWPMPNPMIGELIHDISRLAGQRSARVMLTKLHAGGMIAEHVDEGAYADATERYHVAITSNPGCVMYIGDEAQHAAPGEVWWFDKHTKHTVINEGDQDRVHLIVDCWKREVL